MADVDASGQLVMGNGAVIPLFRADLAEAAEEEIFTDSNFVGSAQNAGTYATQTLGNAVVAAGGVSAENDMTYAFILEWVCPPRSHTPSDWLVEIS